MANDLQSPQQLLNKSSELSNIFLLNMAARHANNPASQNRLFQLQNSNPLHLQQNLIAGNRYVPQVPKLPKRGVNSFMAFRAFYSKIFTAFQQKNSSTLVKLLWDNDPFRAKWAIVARAYTGIRDKVGKVNAPIASFLELVCPKIGIINCNQYFTMMNWIAKSENDSVVLEQFAAPDYSKFPNEIMNTPMTERDVTHFCAQQGYISALTAVQLAGPFPQAGTTHTTPASSNATPQQGLLASAPPQLLTPHQAFIAQGGIGPVVMASEAFGIDIGAIIGDFVREPHRWGNNNFDLYNPEEGIFDFEAHLDNPQHSAWDTFSMEDAQHMNDFLEGGGLQEGYISPEVLPDNFLA